MQPGGQRVETGRQISSSGQWVGSTGSSPLFFRFLFASRVGVVALQVDAKRIYREMYILRHMKHAEIIELRDVIMPPSFDGFRDLYLVSVPIETFLFVCLSVPS